METYKYKINETFTQATIIKGDTVIAECPIRILDNKPRIYLAKANLPSGKLWLGVKEGIYEGTFEDKASILRGVEKGTKATKITLQNLHNYLNDEEKQLLDGWIERATQQAEQEKKTQTRDNKIAKLMEQIAKLQAMRI